jgi:hypothetical protein
MFNKFFISIHFILFLQCIVFSQNPEVVRTNNWYFGDQAGINFSTGVPVALTDGQMNIYYGNSVISDLNGDLLFYTNGNTVWNRNHQIMLNGTGLYSTGTPFQSSVIIPQPGNDSIYFIFHQQGGDGNPELYGLNYSIVNISGNSGNGEVIEKNHQLFKPNTEQLSAIHHSNNCDIWVMAHEYHTNNWNAFLVTNNGIDTIPVVTVIGNQIMDTIATPNHPSLPYGQESRFSSDGSKFASAVFWDNYNYPNLRDTLELYNFDRSTGILSNRITIPDSVNQGVIFSPDGSKLYVGSGTFDAQLYQYDLSNYNQNDILSSKTLIYYDDYNNITDWQQTPTGELLGCILNIDSLQKISQPNLTGISCDFLKNDVTLSGRYCKTALPNFIQTYFNSDTTGCSYVNIQLIDSLDSEIIAFPNPFIRKFQINLSQELIMGISEISLYNILGQQISFKYDIINDKIVVSDIFETGILFINMIINENKISLKLISYE